jgi:hypothetical protein
MEEKSKSWTLGLLDNKNIVIRCKLYKMKKNKSYLKLTQQLKFSKKVLLVITKSKMQKKSTQINKYR